MSVKIQVNQCEDMKNGLCSFCHQPVTLKNGWLEFYVENDTGLHYPTNEGTAVALFAHAECGPDCGYPIELVRVVDEKHWRTHISEKGWACDAVFEGLHFAAVFVKKHARAKTRAKKTRAKKG